MSKLLSFYNAATAKLELIPERRSFKLFMASIYVATAVRDTVVKLPMVTKMAGNKTSSLMQRPWNKTF
ncbi:hypothetical protein PC116_g12069 [Phytophthora cactorum]|nr:hypothetical protein PC116_g12069 [Phytophthora cactorum]